MTVSISNELAEQVKKAVKVLLSGGTVAYPTDTIYGLGADVFNADAVRKVYAAKSRPAGIPLPVLIDRTAQLERFVARQTAHSKALADRFWPGALTIIFDKAKDFQSPVTAGTSKIGIRMPDNPVVRLLIQELGRPIVGTSANLHGGRTPLTAGDVKRQLGNRIDFVIDAGPCSGGMESTIVDVTLEPPAIVRQGIIPAAEIMSVVNETGG
jgi:L-threonylcarbamoyladenylate synthase